MHADDNKQFYVHHPDQYAAALQGDLNSLSILLDHYQLKLNVRKCKVLYLSYKKHHFHNIFIHDHRLDSVDTIRDLGFIVDHKLNFREHVKYIAKRANKVSNAILRSFVSRSPKFLMSMYKTFVLPVMEYGTQIYFPQFKKEARILENVQRSFSRRVYGMSALDYSARLSKLKLDPLELRRIKADLIFVYKLLYVLFDVGFSVFFNFSVTTSTRGNGLKLQAVNVKSRICRNSFANRIVRIWNCLPYTVIHSSTLKHFKTEINSSKINAMLLQYCHSS